MSVAPAAMLGALRGATNGLLRGSLGTREVAIIGLKSVTGNVLECLFPASKL